MASNMDDQGLEDAAILLMSLGEEEAAEVFKHLAPKEVQRLGETIAKMKAIPRDRIAKVIDSFETLAANESMLVADSNEYVKSVLRKALGEDKANLLIDRILQGSDVTGIESLKWMDPGSVAELLRNEHPQIVAAILVHLEFDQCADVLKLFTERQRNEVMVRIATLDGIQPAALRDLNEVMSKVLAGGDRGKKSSLGGVKAAAEILNMLGSSVETSVLDFVREADNDLAQKIMDNMFTFDDVEKIDDKGIQALMKEVQSESLVIALKGATPALREKIFRNMSTRAAETLREDLESRGPVRLSEVEAEQKEMLKIVRRLVDEGQIVLAGGGMLRMPGLELIRTVHPRRRPTARAAPPTPASSRARSWATSPAGRPMPSARPRRRRVSTQGPSRPRPRRRPRRTGRPAWPRRARPAPRTATATAWRRWRTSRPASRSRPRRRSAPCSRPSTARPSSSTPSSPRPWPAPRCSWPSRCCATSSPRSPASWPRWPARRCTR
jgi:flagellar motor switch protein FliG